MIIRATAIPLASFPYSSSSRIVHWLTRNQGRISTLLKGAMRPRSPFLGEYDLFCTSELLYFEKRVNTLHTAKECAMLRRRDGFRTDWRAMQAASYLSALFDRTSPDEAPQPGLFELYEELLDLAETHGAAPAFTAWAELRFCDFHGHAPHLADCVLCGSEQALRFCGSQGGLVCATCSRDRKLPVIECGSDIPAMLLAWQRSSHPGSVAKTRLSGKQAAMLDAVMGTFMLYQFNLPPDHRRAVFEHPASAG